MKRVGEKNYIERLRRKYERRKQEGLDNPEKIRERGKNTEKQTRRRERQIVRNIERLR